MKNLLLFLLALITSPAWAGDAAPDTQTAVIIELKGPAQSTTALIADLEKQAVYKEALCATTPAKKAGKTAKISCTKADSALMSFLSSNTPANVRWSISGTAPTAAGQTPDSTTSLCPTGCFMMNCPPPSGPVKCCRPPAYTPC